MGWKWNDAVGAGVDGFMSYGPYGLLSAIPGGWSKDFDKGLTGNSRSGLMEGIYGSRDGAIGSKIMGNFSGDNRDSMVMNDNGKFDLGKLFGSVGDMAGNYFGGSYGSAIGKVAGQAGQQTGGGIQGLFGGGGNGTFQGTNNPNFFGGMQQTPQITTMDDQISQLSQRYAMNASQKEALRKLLMQQNGQVEMGASYG